MDWDDVPEERPRYADWACQEWPGNEFRGCIDYRGFSVWFSTGEPIGGARYSKVVQGGARNDETGETFLTREVPYRSWQHRRRVVAFIKDEIFDLIENRISWPADLRDNPL